MENTGALNSNTIINDNIRASREAIVEVLEESHADILSEINAAIAKLPEGDTASINDSYAYNISVNANLLISQFCASQDNYENINLRKLKSLIRKNKDGLFSYDVATETVTMEVVVEDGAEGENSPEGNENTEPQTKTVTFTRHTYTVQYAGDAYFADHVFHLTDEQKELAQDYAENLTTFFGNAASGVAMAINLSDEVLSYRPAVERIAAKYGMSEYVELILAVMMQESGGRGLDVMQAAEGSFNTKYPHKPNGITDPEYSIECGIQELKYALEKAGCTVITDLDRIKLALQGYNYGSGYIDWAMERDGGYTKENAIAYSDMMCARPSWPYDRYGRQRVCRACPSLLSDYQQRWQLSCKRNANPALSSDRLWKHSIRRGFHRQQRMRSDKLCYDCQLSYRYYHNSGRCCCLVWKFLLYAGSRYLLALFSGSRQPFRLWLRHTNQRCQSGSASTIGRSSSNQLPKSRAVYKRRTLHCTAGRNCRQ